MNALHEFHAAGVQFPELDRPDLEALTRTIPSEGTLHVAILQQPYFDLVKAGTKTVESRFNTKRAAPYGRVATGDLVLLKLPGEPITHYFFAAEVVYIDLSETLLEVVRADYAAAICAQPEDEFWQSKAGSRYCSLIEVGDRGTIDPLPMIKKDQRGWVSFSRQM